MSQAGITAPRVRIFLARIASAIVIVEDIGKGQAIAQGAKTLGAKHTALAAVEAALCWYLSRQSQYRHMVIHSDSPDWSAIARTEHSGAGSGQGRAKSIQKIIVDILLREGRSANMVWVKGHAGIPGNERADALAGQASEKTAWSTASLARLKLRIWEI
jgi:ribonuclease HI